MSPRSDVKSDPGIVTPSAIDSPPSLWEIFREFLLIGAVSFGGGIVAYERLLLIDKRKWLTPDAFMATLAMSQTLPGLNSVNLALLAGDRIRGFWGACCAALGLMLPGGLFVLIAGVAYSQGEDHPILNILLAGVAAGATGLLASITYKIGEQHFRRMRSMLMILATFVLMSVLKFSLITVLLIMVPIGLYLYRPRDIDGPQVPATSEESSK
ncbi:chromate transporter [Zwartia vadi]|uniref:chromate transporter n=1 Tax=Zwartia vadi TaxID=3058168 RepID=UPI0025B5359E|nr:chromate transporter [Zwartia vadi]MDN3987692.1 chromate transporter [Zwartia vadi]